MGILGETTGFITGTVLLSLVLIAIGLVYFMVTLWTVKTGAAFLGLTPDANWTVFSASIIAAATVLGSKRSEY